LESTPLVNPVTVKDGGPTQHTTIAFPREGTNLSRILVDPSFRQSFHSRLRQYNPLIVALYKIGLLPLVGISRSVMLLTTRGRKTGKLRSTPIGFFRIDGEIHLFSAWGRAAAWYRNMKAQPEQVWIQIGLRKMAVDWIELDDPDEILNTIARLVTESPLPARTLFGWDPAVDSLEQADFSEVINRVLILRFSANSEKRS